MAITESDAQDRADMARLAAGHDAALNDLMERHAPTLFRFLCRLLNNEDDANDLAQETFVRVFQSRAKFDATKKFSTWLFTIAANLARNQIRWRTRHSNVSLEAETDTTERSLAEQLAASTPTPKETVLTTERIAAIRSAVNELPEDLRAALVLCEWEECSQAEAATILNTSPKAVESRLYRARQRLREQLQQWL